MDITTYTHGFTFNTQKDITKREYIELCELISDKINIQNNFIGDSKIKIKPEPITEGGMIFTNGNNNVYGNGNFHSGIYYKSMRHTCFMEEKKTKIREYLNWECINDNTYDEWYSSNEIIFPIIMRGETVLKSFRNAPAWTMDELIIIKECFENYNIICKKMPSKKSLKR